MKKILLLFLLVSFILAGCKKDSSPEVPTDSDVSSVATDDTGSEDNPTDEKETITSNATVSFSDKNADKVITEPTFDIGQYTNNANGDIKPYQIFGNGMCLQRDAINRIWGKASKTKNIAIEFNGDVYYGNVESREWEVYLPKMNAGGPYELTIISEMGRLTLTNVYIGEVFLLSGQSNMELQPQHVGDVLKDLYSSPDCVNDEIRLMQMGWSTPTEPTTEVINYCNWKGANQTTIPSFTAVGYLFGKQMQDELDCPVGLIANPVGGASIEFWLSEANYNKVQEIYKSYTTSDVVMTPCLGYNGMLYPLAGINLRGVLWYQGESNAFGTQQYYDQALNIFMDQCREMFDNEQLLFTICELARFNGNPYAYSVVNERINYVAENDPYVVVARNLDLGEWEDIHPKDKREVAKRAAWETLRVYFQKAKAEPVKVSNYTFNDDGSVIIDLSCDASLVNGVNGFEVYVNGKYTYDCNVSINGNQLTVTAAGAITRVRYGYTCKMTEEIKADVSKMVTVFDVNGFPLDLFHIIKEVEDPSGPSLPEAPILTVGYNDAGYNTTKNDDTGEFTIVKAASAGQWEGAMLDVTGYNSVYTAINIKFTTTNVKDFYIELIVFGGEDNWTQNVGIYHVTIEDGEHNLTIDFSEVHPVDGSTWESVPDKFIKDYQIVAVKFAMDTAVADTANLIKEEGACIIHEIEFQTVTE